MQIITILCCICAIALHILDQMTVSAISVVFVSCVVMRFIEYIGYTPGAEAHVLMKDTYMSRVRISYQFKSTIIKSINMHA